MQPLQKRFITHQFSQKAQNAPPENPGSIYRQSRHGLWNYHCPKMGRNLLVRKIPGVEKFESDTMVHVKPKKD